MTFVAQVLDSGPRNHVIKVTGTGADAAALLVDVSGISGDGLYAAPTRVRLDKVQYDISPAGQVQLLWDATADDVLLNLSEGPGQTMCFKKAGGINNPMSAGATGDVLLTTTADTEYSLILWFVKKYN